MRVALLLSLSSLHLARTPAYTLTTTHRTAHSIPPLPPPLQIGRMMAFVPGWLENQSVWLHMSYKYYLELLRGT